MNINDNSCHHKLIEKKGMLIRSTKLFISITYVHLSKNKAIISVIITFIYIQSTVYIKPDAGVVTL